MIGLNPALASRSSRSCCCWSLSPWTADSSLVEMLRSDLAFSRPAAARSLNDLSPRPPTSYARPTFSDFLAGADDEPPALPPAPLELLLPPPLLPQAASANEAAAAIAPSFNPSSLRKTDRLTLSRTL